MSTKPGVAGDLMTDMSGEQTLRAVYDQADNSLDVTIKNTSPISVTLVGSSGLDIVASYVIDFSDLTTAYFQIDSSSPAISKIVVYETTGKTIQIATGNTGSESVKMTIGPGCDQTFDFAAIATTKLSVRTVGSNATAGSLIINAIG